MFGFGRRSIPATIHRKDQRKVVVASPQDWPRMQEEVSVRVFTGDFRVRRDGRTLSRWLAPQAELPARKRRTSISDTSWRVSRIRRILSRPERPKAQRPSARIGRLHKKLPAQ